LLEKSVPKLKKSHAKEDLHQAAMLEPLMAALAAGKLLRALR
jgi:hypothetical protein